MIWTYWKHAELRRGVSFFWPNRGGRDLAGETGGRAAGWMEKEEDYNFFLLSPPLICSPVDGLAPPPTPRPLCSCFTRRSCGHCAHTHTDTQENARLRQAAWCFVFFPAQTAGCVYSHNTGTALCRVSSERKNDGRDLTGYENKERATTIRQPCFTR